MSATDIIAGLNGRNTATPTVASATGGLDQSAFLRLMTTQLTTQDPFNPVDNTQMVAQMAQFSQVAGIAEMNQNLRALVASMGGGSRFTEASSWIGRAMLVQSDIATPLGDGTYAGELTFDAAAEQVNVAFVDAAGNTVHSMDLGAREAGAAAFHWDGKNAAGELVATGPLQVVVTARAAGSPVQPHIATWTGIAGIQSPANGGESRLVTGLGLLKPEDAIRLA
ncbi:MAG: flagellar hook assembly protein FlgD [Allosphingosinicella sp.]|uniref:flagellar hook assembly protein FlgD n=1 Tax=Allosphingosinicella sp. TaxID=2823234 RepID=UPI003941FA55